MPAHRKSIAQHHRDGTFRPSLHMGRNKDAAVPGVPGTENDAALWDQLAAWQEIFDAALDELRTDGITVQGAKGNKQHPAVKTAREAAAAIRDLSKLLGLGAVNRAKLGVSDDDTGDDLDDELPPIKVRHGY